MKKGLAFCLTVCLLVCCVSGALALPLRDRRDMEISLDAELEKLVDTLLSAAVLRGVGSLENGQTPSQPLVEGVFSMGLMCGTLPDGKGETQLEAERSDTALSAYYAAFFTEGQYAPVTDPVCPCISRGVSGLSFDLYDLSRGPFADGYIYSAEMEGDELLLKCDVLSVDPEYFGAEAEKLPDGTAGWLCGAELLLRCAKDSPYGYTVSAFSLTEDYQAGETQNWKTWNNTEFEYSLHIPPVLGLSQDRADCTVWENSDSTARLTVRCISQQGTYDDMLFNFLEEAGDETVTEHREWDYFTAEGPGIYEMYVLPRGRDFCCTLVFDFPEEYQAEYTLYAEWIRNSLMFWGSSNG